MLRHPMDRWTVVHVAATAAAFGAAWGHSLAWSPVAVFFGSHLIAVEHNHAHLSVFRPRLANRVFDLVLVALCGIPMFAWRRHHLARHHVHTWTERDWSSPFRFRDAAAPDRPVGYRRYQLAYLPRFVGCSLRDIARRRHPRQVLSAGLELGVAVVVHSGVALIFGPLAWALTVGATTAVSGLALGAVNYFEHYGCHDSGDRHLAWTFLCPLHNRLSYNSGYHLLHHERPRLHWSELPAAHRADDRYAPADLVETGRFPGYRSPAARRRWFATHAVRGEA